MLKTPPNFKKKAAKVFHIFQDLRSNTNQTGSVWTCRDPIGKQRPEWQFRHEKWEQRT